MADNPFYPGFNPADTKESIPENPFYKMVGGYYPGEAIARKPGTPYTPPPEFDADYINTFVDEYGQALKKVITFLPQTAIDQVTGDMKQAFNVYATVNPSGTGNVPDEWVGEMGDTKGVAFSININPIDWIKDPVRQAKKVVKDAIVATVNRQDFEIFKAESDIWGPLVNGAAPTPDAIQKIIGDPLVREKILMPELAGSVPGPNPLSLKGRGVTQVTAASKKEITLGPGAKTGTTWNTTDSPTDMYAAAIDSFVGFWPASKVPIFIDGANNKVVSSLCVAVRSEIEQTPGVNRAATALFERHVGVLDDLGEINDRLGDFSKRVNKLRVLGEGRADVLSAIKDLAYVDPSSGLVKGFVQEKLDHIESLRSGLTGRDLAIFNRNVASVEGVLRDCQDLVLGTNDFSTIGLRNFTGKLNVIKSKFDNYVPLSGGVQGEFVQKTAGLLTSRGGAFATELERLPSGGAVAAKRLVALTSARYDREGINNMVSVISPLLDGDIEEFARKFIDKYVWPHVRDRLDGFGPGQIITDIVKERLNSFGLLYTKTGWGEAAANLKFNGTTGQRIFYTILMPFLSENKFGVILEGKKILLRGGEHFKFVPIAEGLVLKYTGVMTDDQFFALLRGDLTSSVFSASGIKLNISDPDKFVKGMQNLSKYLKTDLGIDLDPTKLAGLNATQKKALADRLRSLLEQITEREGNPIKINASAAYVGAAQKLMEKLGAVQKILYDKFGKYIATIVNWKEIVANLLIEGFEDILGITTAGTGFVVKAIRVIIVLVIERVEKFQKRFLKAIKEKGIEGAMSFVEQEITESAKTFGKLIIIIAAPTLFFLSLLSNTIISVISPFDPSRSGGGRGAGSGAFNMDISECIGDPEDGGLGNIGGSTNGIGAKAKTVALGLMRGFWCNWNHHPDFDDGDPEDYWDEEMFLVTPMPSSDFDCLHCMFWCTKLVIESYEISEGEAGISGLYSADKMASWFGRKSNNQFGLGDQGRMYIPNKVGTDLDPGIAKYGIQPGDVVFIITKGGSIAGQTGVIGHVAVVYSVNQDSVETIHSNAYLKRFTYTRNADGTVQSTSDQNGVSSNIIVGFGRR